MSVYVSVYVCERERERERERDRQTDRQREREREERRERGVQCRSRIKLERLTTTVMLRDMRIRGVSREACRRE